MRDTSLDRLTDPFLWARVRGAMLPVDATGRSFAAQLGEITGLGPTEAEVLEEEYRRFLYIAALTSAPREPSGVVRRAWEYHAGFEGYRYDFCPFVLDRHLPAVALSKISAPAYAATRIDYSEEFGAPPPDPYWPTVAPVSSAVEAGLPAGPDTSTPEPPTTAAPQG